MARNKREEAVIEVCRSPAHVDNIVTSLALRREACLHVIRGRGGIVILRVTCNARYTYRREVQSRISGMAA